MSHITIIISRVTPPVSIEAEETEPVTATVNYVVPHEATDAEVGLAIRKLYKQVRDLGS